MNITDLEHLEVVSQKTNLVGGSFAKSEEGGTFAIAFAKSDAVAKGQKTNAETEAKTFTKTFDFYPHH
jgi:hypothetical protein